MSKLNVQPPAANQTETGAGGGPQLKFVWRGFVTVLSAVFILYCLIYVVDLLPLAFGIGISGPQHEGAFLGIILFLAFIILPGKKGIARAKPPWYDVILALLSLLPTFYFTIFYETKIAASSGLIAPTNVVFGWLLAILILEAARRALGWAFTGIVALSILYLLFGNYFPGFVRTQSFSVPVIGEFMYVARDGIFDIPVTIASKIIVTFLFFAQLLFVTGAGDWFVAIANSIAGHVRGGPAKVAIVASGGFGMLSGGAPANVATTGAVTIPMMKKIGYSPTFAAAVEAVASTGGGIMPPIMGSAIFILSEWIGMPYWQVIIYAFVPALLYYLALFLMADLNAAKMGLRGLPKAELPQFWQTAKQGVWYLLPIIVLLYCLIGLTYSPQKSAIWAIASLIIISLFRRKGRMNPMTLVRGSERAVRALVVVAVAIAGVSIITGSLALSGLGYKLSFQLVDLSGGHLIVLLMLAAATSYIMGMGVGPLVCYLTLAMMVAPALVNMGVYMLSAHLFIFYWAITSFITPPHAIAAFVAAGIAESDPFRTGFLAMRLGIATYIVPFIFVYKPALLLNGSPPEIAVTILFSIIGIASLAAGAEGYLLRKLNWLQRILLVAGGITFVLSSGTVQIIAGAALAAAVLWHLMNVKIRNGV